jgi:hypothetical protein
MPSDSERRPAILLQDELLASQLAHRDEEDALALALAVSTVQQQLLQEQQHVELAAALEEEEAHEASIIAAITALPICLWSEAAKPGLRGTGTSTYEHGRDRCHTPAPVPEGDALDEAAEECSLCMDAYGDSSKVRVLSCGAKHYFHSECIDKWLIIGQRRKDRTCPMCQECPI